MSESWQELEDAEYYEYYMRREESGGGAYTDQRVLTAGRAAGRTARTATEEGEEEDVNLALHYVHTRESSNEADPEGNPFSSASTVSRFSPLPVALTREWSQRRMNRTRPQPLGSVVVRPGSVMDEYNPTFKLNYMQPPPPSPPGMPTLIVSPPPPVPVSTSPRSRQLFRPNLWSTMEPTSHESSTGRLSRIGMAL